jgi:hypothetical protein
VGHATQLGVNRKAESQLDDSPVERRTHPQVVLTGQDQLLTQQTVETVG